MRTSRGTDSSSDVGSSASSDVAATSSSVRVAEQAPAAQRARGGARRPLADGPTPRRSRVRRRERLLLTVLHAAALPVAALLHQLWTGETWLPRSWSYAFAVLGFIAMSGMFRPKLTLRALDDVPGTLTLLAAPLLVALPLEHYVASGWQAGPTIVVLGGTLLAARALSFAIVRALRRAGRSTERAVVVGAGMVARELAETMLQRPVFGLWPLGFVDLADVRARGETLPLPVLGAIEDLPSVIRAHRVRHLVVAFGRVREADWIKLLRIANVNGIEVHVVPRFFDMAVPAQGANTDEIAGIVLHRVGSAAPRKPSWLVKRVIDVALATTLLILLSPVLAVISAIVHLTSPGGVLFRQTRVGIRGQAFELLKFRSMRVNDDGDTTWSVDDDDRQTPIGRVLRRTSLDELPQLVNVVRGDMSLVGPRPERPFYAEQFEPVVPGYEERVRVPVGMTGWAQVNGLRGDTSISRRVRYDNMYIEHWSLWFDIKVLARTVLTVIRDFGRMLRPRS